MRWLWIAILSVPWFLACDWRSDYPIGGGALTIRVRGEEFEWHIRYPGPDGALDTPDDVYGMRNLHVPLDTAIHLEFESEDYVYGFRLPDFDVNQPAIPDLHFEADFEADLPGHYALMGNQMCGYAHESLLGHVIVQTPSKFRDWLQARSP